MKTRKFLSVLVAAVLLIATVSVIGILSVHAETVTVSSADELVTKIGEGKTDIKLGANLDLTGIDSLTFAGTLDGNGKTVTVSKPLFNTLSGEVKNLTIDGTITSDSTGTIGALANTVSGNLTVTNVTNGASVTAESATGVGGVVGTVANNATVIFTRVVNNGDVQGKEAVGGIIAYIGTGTNTTIHESVNTGSILMADADAGVGGILGSGAWGDNTNEVVTITYCVNTGSVASVVGDASFKGRGRAAGIIGRLNKGASKLTVDYCYNAGAIKLDGSPHVDDSAAGIAAYVQNAYITNCYNVGTLTSTSNRYEIGRSRSDNSANCSNNYYIERGIGNHSTTSATPCADKEALNTALCALGQYCVNPALNDGYAILKWQCVHSEPNCEGKCVYCAEVIGEAGDHTWSDWAEKTPATATHAKVEERSCSVCSEIEERTVGEALGAFSPVEGVYNVENENQLVWLVYQINEGEIAGDVSIAIKNDITLTNGLDMITPTFSGKFDGEGNTISGLNNTMFKRTASGFTFTNVTLEGEIDYTEIGDAEVCRMAASVSLYAEGGYVLENVVSYVDIQSVATNLNAGGLLGFANQGQITNCTYGGTYTIDWTAGKGGAVGGLVGWLNDNSKTSYITNSSFTGNFTIANSAANDNGLYVGGLVGRSRNSGSEIITGCVSNGSLTVTATGSTIYVGGLVGAFDGQKANDITNCVANNDISADAAKYGSFVGYAGGAIPFTNCVSLIDAEEVATCGSGTLALTNCYYNDTIETIGDAFTMGGVEYQRYNFGYLNTATSALVSTGEVASNAIDAFMSYRDNADKHDVRFVLLANLEALKDVSVANVSIVFTLGGEEVRVETGKFGGNEGTFVPYQAVLAADEPFFAAEGYAYFGLVMVDIPDGAWDSVTLTVTNAANDEVICTGTQTYAGIQE